MSGSSGGSGSGSGSCVRGLDRGCCWERRLAGRPLLLETDAMQQGVALVVGSSHTPPPLHLHSASTYETSRASPPVLPLRCRRFKIQKFNACNSDTSGSLLLLSAISILIPTAAQQLGTGGGQPEEAGGITGMLAQGLGMDKARTPPHPSTPHNIPRHLTVLLCFVITWVGMVAMQHACEAWHVAECSGPTAPGRGHRMRCVCMHACVRACVRV